MDALDFLKQEHEKAKAAFAKIEGAAADERGRLWNELRPELEVHEQIEETCLYDPVEADLGDRDQVLAGWNARHQAEVDDVEELLEAIDELDPHDPEWLATIVEVRSALERHIREEEGNIFPRISRGWERSRREQAGASLQQMKSDRMRRAA